MSGKTQRLFVVDPLIRDGRALGFVGKIRQVNPAVVIDAIQSGQVPVISPISANEDGDSFNVNADSAAAALAAAAHCTDLVFITDVPGVLIDGQTRSSLSIAEAQTLIAEGIIQGGMVAKMESAFEALDRDVPRVHIIQWQGPDTLRSIINRKSTAGTVIQS
jgi:acetylglutamate kinase